MDFKRLGDKERKVLLEALDFDLNNLSCEYCKKKVGYKECGIMPSFKKDELATIICDNPLCVAEYLIHAEDEKKKIKIIIEKGNITNVENLPNNYDYEVINKNVR